MRIYVPDIECDSCVKIISKKLTEHNIQYQMHTDAVDTENTEEAIKIIQNLGFRASTVPFERKCRLRRRGRGYRRP